MLYINPRQENKKYVKTQKQQNKSTQTTNKAYLRKTKDPDIWVLLFYKASHIHIGYMKPIK